ncbi:unnamed protein product [Caenorhabditis angaria]|uniref:Uncharacterized protein n=1 Tax=Caenorhabditis angaria TaxID=860376 RepID=A0A9P1IS98_9PELO|nr:unnamed protein product [Caenorhabditis angaria]
MQFSMKSLFDRIQEAKQCVGKNVQLFVIHLWICALVGFSITLISLGYSHSACYLNMSPAHLFNLHFAFNASIFIGSVFHSNLSRRLPIKHVISISIFLILTCFGALPNANHFMIFCTIFVIFGTCLGILISAITTSFCILFRISTYILVHIFHFINALGSVIVVFLYQATPSEHQNSCAEKRNPVIHNGPHIPSLEKFYMNPAFRADYIYYITAILNIPLFFLVLRSNFNSSLTASISIRRVDEENSNCQSLTTTSDVHSLKLVLLCSIVACIANIMYTLFPFLVLTQPGSSIFYYQIFAVFFTWGRITAIFVADYMAPYFLLGVSIFGCGVGVCAISSEQFLIGSMVFGFFLSPLLPALITYINQGLSLKYTNTFTLLSGHCSGYSIFPLLLTLTTTSNSRLFIAFNFVSIVILVIILVSILSLHAQIERMQASQSGLNLFVSRFLSGESLLKRTRSIRPLISRLRPNSYRRFANRRGMTPRSPSPNPSPIQADEMTHLMSISPAPPSTLLIPTRV